MTRTALAHSRIINRPQPRVDFTVACQALNVCYDAAGGQAYCNTNFGYNLFGRCQGNMVCEATAGCFQSAVERAESQTAYWNAVHTRACAAYLVTMTENGCM